MSKLLSAIREPILVRGPCRAPIVVGKYETRRIAPIIRLEALKPVEVTPEAAEIVLSHYGKRGVIEVRSDESPEDAALRAKEVRLDYLQAFFDDFRNQNAELVAQGIPPRLPRKRHRLLMAELEAVQKELFPANLLPGGVLPPRQADAAATDLAKFGLPSQVTQLTPGVPAALTGIGVDEL